MQEADFPHEQQLDGDPSDEDEPAYQRRGGPPVITAPRHQSEHCVRRGDDDRERQPSEHRAVERKSALDTRRQWIEAEREACCTERSSKCRDRGTATDDSASARCWRSHSGEHA
jgi:hypothetical protein